MRVRNGTGRDAEKGISGTGISLCPGLCQTKRCPAAAKGRPGPSGRPVLIGQPGHDFYASGLVVSCPAGRGSALPRASLDFGTSCVAQTPGP